jgi:two-component system, cell cycle response regulator DivK
MTQSAAGPLVLIAEDDPALRSAYTAFLGVCGFRVLEAADGASALQAAAAERPAVIIMDLELPHVDGWTATRLLKNDTRTCDIPVLVASAHMADTARRRAFEAGCDSYVPKSCGPEDLVRELHRLLAIAAEAQARSAHLKDESREIRKQSRDVRARAELARGERAPVRNGGHGPLPPPA